MRIWSSTSETLKNMNLEALTSVRVSFADDCYRAIDVSDVRLQWACPVSRHRPSDGGCADAMKGWRKA
jgi:hypothetical protein